MDLLFMVPLTARANRIACSTAARLATGSVPGSAMSTAEAWVLGAAPKAFGAPENILLCVRSWVWVSMPTTISQAMLSLRAQQLAACAPVDEDRLEVGFGAALRGAVLGGDLDVLAEVAQRDAAAAARE